MVNKNRPEDLARGLQIWGARLPWRQGGMGHGHSLPGGREICRRRRPRTSVWSCLLGSRALAGAWGPEWVHRRGPQGSEGGLVHECHQRGPPKPRSHWLMSWKQPSGDGKGAFLCRLWSCRVPPAQAPLLTKPNSDPLTQEK